MSELLLLVVSARTLLLLVFLLLLRILLVSLDHNLCLTVSKHNLIELRTHTRLAMRMQLVMGGLALLD
jgi:hypothetical protein